MVDVSDDRVSLFSNTQSVASAHGMPTFIQTFHDSVVTFKTAPTKANKSKLDVDLGVTPLDNPVQKTLDHQFATVSTRFASCDINNLKATYNYDSSMEFFSSVDELGPEYIECG